MAHKSGFVNIFGKPNVGKSTIMNRLIGQELSVVTAKAQTTRQRVIGLLNGEDYQVVFTDTPGILDPKYKLQESMIKSIETATEDADVILLVIEAGERELESKVEELMSGEELPRIIVVNKIDLSEQAEVETDLEYWQEKFPGVEVIPAAGLHGFNMEKILQSILDRLPESPPWFPKDELSDRNERFFISEIIRKRIMLNYRKEVPYSVEVVVDSYKDEGKIIRIEATIFVARETQRAIILGKGGAAIKKTGTEARLEIEEFLDRHIFLELSVKVSKDWRNNEQQLRRFGYEI